MPNAILHGGTAIWRIYSGKRFSEDLDLYLTKEVKDKNKIKPYLKQLIDNYKKPHDKEDIKTIILEGIVPTSEEMLEYVKQNISKEILKEI